MRILFRIGALALLPLLMASCLTIEESYLFKRNGSGSMTYTLDMSEMASLLKMSQESEDAEDPTGDMGFEAEADRLSGISGISGVKANSDKDNYIFSVSFKFASLDALNAALTELILNDEEGSEPVHEFFRMENNAIVATHRMKGNPLTGSELMGDDEESEQAAALMESMKYKKHFTFASSVQTVYSGSDASISGKKDRELHLESNFRQLMEDGEALNASIVLK
jgi:hypothetical protein